MFRALDSKKPLWLPSTFDIGYLFPQCVPDNPAKGNVSDAKLPAEQLGGKDMFGVEWEYVPVVGGSTTRPGHPLMTDANDWPQKVVFPTKEVIDSWDWDGCKKRSDTLMRKKDMWEIVICTGFYERLISFMDFEGAAVAMIDEDQEDAIKRNPMRKIKSIKLDKLQARRPLTPEELERLRDGCCTYREKALVEFLVSSGCRLSETVGIRVDQIDWRERSVEVLGKGGKRRVVYFSVRAALMIQAYMEQRRGGEALFASSKAPYEPMSPRAIERAVETVGVRAGERRRIHPHLLRHTFATNALHAGMDLTVIQHLLGHSDPKTTMIYAELRPDAVKYAYERVIA